MARPYQQPSSTPDPPSVSGPSDTRRKPGPQFYLNSSTGVSPALVPRDGRHNHASTTHMSIPSLPSTPSHSRRTSRASLAALRTALQTYQIHSPDDYPNFSIPSTDVHPSTPGLRPDERMDALVEIHRVLYRGKEDHEGEILPWKEQGPEVKRVVERWFETDCSYDHPLVRLSSRQAVLTHFVLLHLLSTAYLPSITPANIIFHVRNITSQLRSRLLGSDERERDVRDVEEGTMSRKGKTKMLEEEWMCASDEKKPLEQDVQADKDSGRWFRIWDVSADCKEIGNMECYGGYHLAMIEHVISLTLFPSILRRRIDPDVLLQSSASSDSIHSLDLIAPKTFTGRVAAAIADEFDYLLRWDLPVSTTVHFNEVGKATHVRDSIDLLDLVETFVPFAKRLGWLTRRVTGLVSSTMGSVALALIPGPSVQVGDAIKVAADGKRLRSPIGLGLELSDTLPRRASHPSRPSSKIRQEPTDEVVNTLGLEGMPSAPDYHSAYE